MLSGASPDSSQQVMRQPGPSLSQQHLHQHTIQHHLNNASRGASISPAVLVM